MANDRPLKEPPEQFAPPPPPAEKRFTSWSMWISLGIAFAVYTFLSIVCVFWLAFSSSPNTPDPFPDPARFFDVMMPVMIVNCICILICLAVQISRKTNWRQALGVEVFPDRKAWLRALPVGALFVVVISALTFALVNVQLLFAKNATAMFEQMEHSMAKRLPAEFESSNPPRITPSFADGKNFEEQMQYILRYPFENGFLSKGFLLYLLAFLLFALINEIIFRGIGFAGYQKPGSNMRAVLVPGIVNGMALFPFAIAPSLLLGWVRLRSGSLYCSLAAAMAGAVAVVLTVYFMAVTCLP